MRECYEACGVVCSEARRLSTSMPPSTRGQAERALGGLEVGAGRVLGLPLLDGGRARLEGKGGADLEFDSDFRYVASCFDFS